MDWTSHRITPIGIKPKKRFGQNFLTSKDIAMAEAEYGISKNVIEFGPGLGMLTNELCKVAKRVLAIERDESLCSALSANLDCENLKLLNKDFFEVDDKEFSGYDIMISNIPYNLSSKTILWLGNHDMPALLCLQKEFVDHMMAKPDTGNYSHLSVVSHLKFEIKDIMKVPASNFYPKPKVDSKIIYIKPKRTSISEKELDMLSLIMMHKKKTVRNAIMDSGKALGRTKERVAKMAENAPYHDKRVFKLSPEELLEIAGHLSK